LETLRDKIIKDKLPKSVAIIMDGNGRWAKKQGKDRLYGHQHGVTSVRNVAEVSAELGIKYLTLYTFSKENWNRPKQEIDGLMQMLVYTIKQEEKTLMDNNIKLETIGDLSEIVPQTKQALLQIIDKTKNNSRMTMVLALNYSSRWEIIEASKSISQKVQQGVLSIDDIDEEVFANNLTTRNYIDPDLLIRTSGEERISNFLLWQIAYTELYFTDTLWPDFTKEEYYKALINYQNRERRFGKTSEQLEN
jgi:undecaprenyl diphosphate synthase